MKMFFEGKKRRIEDNINETIKNGGPKVDNAQEINEDALFEQAEFDPNAGERTGYSNYSYWGSTFRAFMHNKLAVALMILLAALVLFTVIQPLLPGQFEAVKSYSNPLNPNKSLPVKPPSLTTVVMQGLKGDQLVYKQVNEDWYGVKNTIDTIQSTIKGTKRSLEKFTVLDYGAQWIKIERDGRVGYIKTMATDGQQIVFQGKEVPEDLTQTPYETYSWQEIAIYAEPKDMSQNGDYLYVEAEYLEILDEENACLISDAALRDYPSRTPFILGTNDKGQDLWARIWSGTRTSLWIGFVVAVFEVFIGIIVGIIWGYVRALDRIITEIYNVIDNIPTTIILVLVSYIMRPGVGTLILAMSLTRWLGMARFIRNQIIIIRDRDYNLASRCLGTEPSRIMLRNLLPYLVSVIMLRMALAIPNAIGSEVFITYIGLGLSVNTPSLGNLLIEGRELINVPGQQYQLIYSSLVLSVITISFYIIGNAFADAADPKNHV